MEESIKTPSIANNEAVLTHVSQDNYGDAKPIQTQTWQNREFTEISELTSELQNTTVLLRARVHAIRATSNVVFLVLRHQNHTVQAVLFKSPTISKTMIKYVSQVSCESLVEVQAKVVQVQESIRSTTQDHVELQLQKFLIVSKAHTPLPIQLEDAQRPEWMLVTQDQEIREWTEKIKLVKEQLANANGKAKIKLERELKSLIGKKGSALKYVKTSLTKCLDNRIIDLRTTTNQAIFRIQSGVCALFREFLTNRNFIEIHSPKIISTASEGGASVFELKYFETNAYLAQSPQLYKQMAICSDFERVFEIGPVFRAENSNTHRHMTEFTGLDFEMTFKDHYHEVLEVIEQLFIHIFEGINERFAQELRIIKKQYPFEDIRFSKHVLRISFKQAIEYLNEVYESRELRERYAVYIERLQKSWYKDELDKYSHEVSTITDNNWIENGLPFQKGELEDISTTEEQMLGDIMAEKYHTDFYVIDKFPLNLRPFYTMPDPDQAELSNSYDIFVRGEEIMSGAQRVHDYELLMSRAREHMKDLSQIQSYIDAFKYGAPLHAGGGIGLERLIMLFLGLGNIRKTSLFPRTPDRLEP